MAEKPKVLALIPAHGGSKRVPRKNLKTFKKQIEKCNHCEV